MNDCIKYSNRNSSVLLLVCAAFCSGAAILVLFGGIDGQYPYLRYVYTSVFLWVLAGLTGFMGIRYRLSICLEKSQLNLKEQRFFKRSQIEIPYDDIQRLDIPGFPPGLILETSDGKQYCFSSSIKRSKGPDVLNESKTSIPGSWLLTQNHYLLKHELDEIMKQ